MSTKRGRWLGIYSWLLLAYLLVPILGMIFFSFNDVLAGRPTVTFEWNGATLRWYRELTNVVGLPEAFWLSIRLAVASMVVATVVGTLLALALVRYEGKRFRGRSIVDQTLFMNIAAPEIVMGASLLGLFASYHVARGFLTLLLSHTVFSIAYVTVTVRARLQGFDRHLEEAAGDLGATPLTTFRLVTLPMIMPGVLAGAMMAFALSLDDFVVSNFVSGTTLPFPVWVYGASRMGVPPQVFVFGTIIFLLGFAGAIASLMMSRRSIKTI